MEIALIIGLACFITACFLAALTGAWFRPGEWYEQLKKPSWRPPNRLFAPVWTILYVMIAVAGWLIWREAGFAGAGNVDLQPGMGGAAADPPARAMFRDIEISGDETGCQAQGASIISTAKSRQLPLPSFRVSIGSSTS